MKEYKIMLSYGGLKTRDGTSIDLVPSEISFIGASEIDRYRDARESAMKGLLGYLAEQVIKSNLTPNDYPIFVSWHEYRRNTWQKNPDWKFFCDNSLSIPWR